MPGLHSKLNFLSEVGKVRSMNDLQRYKQPEGNGHVTEEA